MDAGRQPAGANSLWGREKDIHGEIEENFRCNYLWNEMDSYKIFIFQ